VGGAEKLLGVRAGAVFEARPVGIPPEMVSPAVKIPAPVGTSPFHSALAFVASVSPCCVGSIGGRFSVRPSCETYP
jgi:hypothetical protein